MIRPKSQGAIQPGRLAVEFVVIVIGVLVALKRISIKGRHVAEEFGHLKEITRINSTSDLIKGVVLKINDDVLVNKKLKTIKALKIVVAATI